MATWLVYWKNDEIDRALSTPGKLFEGAKSIPAGTVVGDKLLVCTIRQTQPHRGKLILCGLMDIFRSGKDGGDAKHGTARPFKEVDATDLASEVRFDAPTVSINMVGALVQGQALRSPRRLTPASSRLLVGRFLSGDSERTSHVGDSYDEDDEVWGIEGDAQVLLVKHRQRERRLREAKIAAVLRETGSLKCCVPACGFDFQKTYGVLGENFAHVHHVSPLSIRNGSSKTSLDELAIVCANCHSIIHRGGTTRSLTAINKAILMSTQRSVRSKRVMRSGD